MSSIDVLKTLKPLPMEWKPLPMTVAEDDPGAIVRHAWVETAADRVRRAMQREGR